MNPTTFLVAAMLILSPADQQEEMAAEVKELYGSLRHPLTVLSVEWEILDPRECRYVFARYEDFPNDLNLIRRRNHELADAPSANDCYRFPERTTVNEFLAFNRSYRQHLDIRLPGNPARWWELRTALQETDQLYTIWDTVRDARCEYYYVTVRRQALKRLRELIGEADYYSSNLPPYVPLRNFTEVNDR